MFADLKKFKFFYWFGFPALKGAENVVIFDSFFSSMKGDARGLTLVSSRVKQTRKQAAW